MIKFFTILSAILFSMSCFGQGFTYKIEKNLSSLKLNSFKMSSIPNDTAGFLMIQELAPEPASNASEAKAILDAKRVRKHTPLIHHKYIQDSEKLVPELKSSYNGLPIGQAGTPNDNNMAISNEGFVVSVVNSSISMFDNLGNSLGVKSLRAFVGDALPNLDRTYDPKISFDPEEQKFILVFLQGSTSNDTRIIVGFSEGQDPTENWNFYALNGNPFGGKIWSDYPIIGMSKDDFFVTVNILRDGESWQEGFEQSVIWQVDKRSGFEGADSLFQNVVYDIKYEDKSLWSICAVQGAPLPTDDVMYFLTVRPGDLSNDSVFLHKLSNNQRSNDPKYELKVLKASLPYGVPPSAFQPEIGFKLQTNDTRVLSAIISDDIIQYVQSTNVPNHDPSAVVHNVLDLSTEEITSHYYTSDTLEFAYPSIAYAGSAKNPHASVVTFSHVGEFAYPGTSAFFHNMVKGYESIYSPVVRVKQGEGLINSFLADSIERWGDYTGIQTKFNEEGVVWVSGSFGSKFNRNAVWVGELKVNNQLDLEVNESSIKVFPNPVNDRLQLSLGFVKDASVKITIYNSIGQSMRQLYDGDVKRGEQLFYFDRGALGNGNYFIRVEDESGEELGHYQIHVN
jgi:hypothetical protein